jgi:hypothetical protein
MLSGMTTNEPPPYPGEPNPSANDPQTPPPPASEPPSHGSTPPPPGAYPPPPAGGYPPPPGAYPPPAPGGYGAPPQQNKKALWAMILGIIGILCCGFFTGIPALILGNMAKNEIRVSGGTQTGGGMATAGVVMGIISIVLGVISIVLFATGTIDLSST